MNKILTPLLAMVCCAAISTDALANCTIYQHRDYGGSSWTLGHFDRMKMVNGESLGGTTNGHGGGCESTLYEPS
jgi:syncollin